MVARIDKVRPDLKRLNGHPRAFNAAMSARVTVVLPTPLWVPAMITRGRCLMLWISWVVHDFPPNETRTPPKIDRMGVPALAISSYFSLNRFSARR